MHIFLCAFQDSLLAAWNTVVCTYVPVIERRGHSLETVSGDITGLSVAAVVSPANSYGYMRGGVDLAYTHFFGPGVEVAVQRRIAALPGQLLPVGEAIAVATGNERIPYLVSAPTMERPMRLEGPEPVLVATRAATVESLRQGYPSVAFPGMGTGTGGLPFVVAARAMLQGIVEGLERI